MSVAFRRESDEEHLEPKFELPIPPGPNLVTQQGLDLIEARVAGLEARLGEETVEEARKSLLRDLRYWRSRRATAQLVPKPSGDEVAIGTRVTYRLRDRDRTLEIVGHDENDPASARIAFTAPLVRAMLGALEGDEVALPGGDMITVISIAVPSPD